MQNAEKDIGRRLILAAGFIAAGVFVFVSMAANFRFGLALGRTVSEDVYYSVILVAADLVKVSFPGIVLMLWQNRHHLFALSAAIICAASALLSFILVLGWLSSLYDAAIAIPGAILVEIGSVSGFTLLAFSSGSRGAASRE